MTVLKIIAIILAIFVVVISLVFVGYVLIFSVIILSTIIDFFAGEENFLAKKLKRIYNNQSWVKEKKRNALIKTREPLERDLAFEARKFGINHLELVNEDRLQFRYKHIVSIMRIAEYPSFRNQQDLDQSYGRIKLLRLEISGLTSKIKQLT